MCRSTDDVCHLAFILARRNGASASVVWCIGHTLTALFSIIVCFSTLRFTTQLLNTSINGFLLLSICYNCGLFFANNDAVGSTQYINGDQVQRDTQFLSYEGCTRGNGNILRIITPSITESRSLMATTSRTPRILLTTTADSALQFFYLVVDPSLNFLKIFSLFMNYAVTLSMYFVVSFIIGLVNLIQPFKMSYVNVYFMVSSGVDQSYPAWNHLHF